MGISTYTWSYKVENAYSNDMTKTFNWEEEDKEVDEKLRNWLVKKKIQKLKHSNDGKEESIKEGEDVEAVERAIRLSRLRSQPPSLLTMENFNSREQPNPKLEWKMKNWLSHK